MDIQALKEKIDSLDPTMHAALRDALTNEYGRLCGAAPDTEPHHEPIPDLLLDFFQKATDEINKRYIQGTIAYISRDHPDLDRRINEAESAVNDIWLKCERGEASVDEFKEKVEVWYRMNLKAIDIYSKEQRK